VVENHWFQELKKDNKMKTKIVGILNITPDSFSDGNKFNSLTAAIDHAKKMIDEGADIIDIGAESTRPTAIKISHHEEWQRLEKILPELIKFIKNYSPKIKTSIDSYHFETIEKAHQSGVDIINDVSGLVDENIINFIAEKNIETILMHNEKINQNPEIIINQNINLVDQINAWAKEKIKYLVAKGVDKSKLIFDPGIGFNKNAAQSTNLIKNIEKFHSLNLAIYVGHSKKSFLENIDMAGSRAEKTIEISKYLTRKGVDYLRVHDVKENILAIKSSS
jgi:dihydropteroate synthase